LAERKAGITKSTEAEPPTVISAEWTTSKGTVVVKGEIFHGEDFSETFVIFLWLSLLTNASDREIESELFPAAYDMGGHLPVVYRNHW
jgi:hypothetical protein